LSCSARHQDCYHHSQSIPQPCLYEDTPAARPYRGSICDLHQLINFRLLADERKRMDEPTTHDTPSHRICTLAYLAQTDHVHVSHNNTADAPKRAACGMTYTLAAPVQLASSPTMTNRLRKAQFPFTCLLGGSPISPHPSLRNESEGTTTVLYTRRISARPMPELNEKSPPKPAVRRGTA
jgi:hypothetical protein